MISRLISLPAIIICLTLHECGHGLAARLLGDRTAELSGRLSLNPLRHIDPMGLVMMLLFGFGWAKPVPVDPYGFRNPKTGMALAAAAGPLANVLTAAVLLPAVPFLPGYAYELGYMIIAYSIGLAAFNLLPIPPLDGSRIIAAFMPDGTARRWAGFDRYGWFVLIALSYSGLLSWPVSAVRDAILRLLSPIAMLPWI